MNFKMNDRTWRIKEVSQEALRLEAGDVDGKYFGLAIPEKQEVWIWEDLHEEQKRKTLCHELMHCYTMSYITFNQLAFKEDDWADISANSHDIIHEIVEEYFKKRR